MSVTPSQLTDMLAGFIMASEPILITGAPGVGKSDLVAQAALAAGADLILSHPAVADPTDAKGLPWPVAGKDEATFLPFGELAQAIKATKKTVWFLDDLGQATPAVQASFMQLLLARRVNGHKLPDCVSFVAATNRRTDRAGVSGILEPVKSRFVTIVDLEPTIDDWTNWAFANGVPPMEIAYLRFRPEMLSKFTASADMSNSPMPRTWAHVARIEKMGLRADIEAEAMAGAVGQGAAGEYLAFRQMANSLVNLDGILLDPDHAAIPTEPNELYATVVGLAGKATPLNFDRIATYTTRLYVEAERGEFAVLLVRDAQRREPMITHTNGFVKLAAGPVGKLFTGQI